MANFTHPESYIASLKRLYEAGKIEKSYLETLLNEGKLTEAEYLFIIS